MKFYKTDRKSGFTLVELLVVISMLMILAGAVSTSVASSERRAKISRATAEAKELTNAIIAYSHFISEDNDMPQFASWKTADKATLGFVIGEGKQLDGVRVPVLYNASFNGTRLLDPWKRPYEVMIKKTVFDKKSDKTNKLKSFVAFPNYNRRPADK